MSEFTKRNLKLVANVLLTIIGTILGIYLVIKGISYFMPFVIGFIIALIGTPIVRFLENKLKLKKKISSVIIMVLVIGIILVLGYFAFKAIIGALLSGVEKLPSYYENFLKDFDTASDNARGIFGSLPNTIQHSINLFIKNIGNNVTKITSSLGNTTITKVGEIASKLPYILISTIITILSAYYFMADGGDTKNKIKNILPSSVNSKIELVKEEILHGIGGYFKAQFKIMIVIYIVLLAGLLFLKAAYAPLVALLIAFLDLLPVFGTGFVLLPWAIFKFFTGNYFMMVGLVVLYIICLVLHQALQPSMIGDSLEMPPMLTLVCVFVGFKTGGIIGMIIAIIIGLIIWRLYNDKAFDKFISNFNELWDNLSKAIEIKDEDK